MLRVFNAFQITVLFSAMPYIIAWLHSDPFPYAVAAFWTAIVTYVVLFVLNVVGMSELFGDW